MARDVKRSTLTKLTVNITSKTSVALEQAITINDESKTDTVNRAIKAYAFLTRMINAGWDLVIRDPDGNEKMVQLL